MTDDRTELHNETLTNLPLRLETVLLAPNTSGASSTPSDECLPAADCSGLTDGDNHTDDGISLDTLVSILLDLLRTLRG